MTNFYKALPRPVHHIRQLIRSAFFAAALLFASTSFGQSARASADNDNPGIVKFYPNPASSVIYFDLSGAQKNISFQVYNFMGKVVYEQQNASNKNTIDLSNFFRGVYIFQLRNKSGKIIESGKFQVIK